VSGLPVVMLTTTGAKTGQQRVWPVIGLSDGDNLAAIASNWGQRHHLQAGLALKRTGRSPRPPRRPASISMSLSISARGEPLTSMRMNSFTDGNRIEPSCRETLAPEMPLSTKSLASST
jgi:F420H(2)-dependent quinone reductase